MAGAADKQAAPVAPAHKKRGSVNRKSQWRKRVDISEIEAHLDAERKQELVGCARDPHATRSLTRALSCPCF